jgi:hypothetical protein
MAKSGQKIIITKVVSKNLILKPILAKGKRRREKQQKKTLYT